MSFAAALVLLLQNNPAPQGTPTGGSQPTGSGMQDMVFLVVALIGIMYFVVLRPANRERKKQAEMMSTLKKGDRVMMTSGLYATVAALSERDVWVKIDDKNPTRLRFQKQSIQVILKADDAAAAEPGEPESK